MDGKGRGLKGKENAKGGRRAGPTSNCFLRASEAKTKRSLCDENAIVADDKITTVFLFFSTTHVQTTYLYKVRHL